MSQLPTQAPHPPTGTQQPLQPPPPMGQNIAPTGAFPGSLTPGWNDPPPISAEAASNLNSRRPRLDLRKRVAYPMDQPPLQPQPQPPL
ncbi:hypothetical protein KR215_005740 [Drosophila sulfurigaster]|uniref:Uncharacterized protein LOC117563944 n=1 Tax=Drosophila albomicans TaxID=7291 RepID=A0A6P8WKS7_DROAB|nr:uncharacterized protein LOC117563944 [Drosophila albomicans]XP_060661779.1 uncharacterized protein LOC132795209 [Drosophila nasuta]XP_062138138.1 uncharacterized protein LOC133847250 [Drosophila sulfurigaster albostrigata]KAH8411509.1 hypothetical protein KR215_005740 [Drosophila sulfurigaster]